MNDTRIVLKGPVVVLCEGQHDAAFLDAIAVRTGCAGMLDLPFFERRDGRWQGRDGFPHGSSAIAGQLLAVAQKLLVSPDDAARVERIIMVRDCGDDASAVLGEAKGAFSKAKLPVPDKAGDLYGPADRVRIALLLLPHAEQTGSLETLCLRYLRERHVKKAACLDSYFACLGPPNPVPTGENRSKAMLACLIAAIRPGNPTQTLSVAFSGTTPLIDVTDPIFTPFAEALRALIA